MKTNLKKLFSIIALPALILFCLGTFAQGFSIPPEGQAVIADEAAGTNELGALFIVNLVTGERTLVSDFGNPSQGPTGDDPIGITLENFVTALVADEAAGTNSDGALFRVNLRTGSRILISDFGDPSQGPIGGRGPVGLVLDGLGNAIVIDDDGGSNFDGALFSVDLTTGNRIIISDFGDPAQGPIGNNPTSIALDSSGNALVTDEDAVDNGALFSVDLATGQRTVISDFQNPAQGPVSIEPVCVISDGQGNALVTDDSAGMNGDGALFSVILPPQPGAGNRSIISDFNDPAQGPTGANPQCIALDGTGDALVTDILAGTDERGLLFRVNTTSGQRTVISDFGNPAQGPLGELPTGIAFRSGDVIVRPIPTLSELGLIATAAILGLAGLYAVRRRRITT